MKYYRDYPGRHFHLDRPSAVPPLTSHIWDGKQVVPFTSKGFSVEELEEMNSRGLYEWIDINNPV
jgi:hypothetical protein